MKPSRLFYTLLELAEKWGCTENDLLHQAMADELVLSVKYRGWAFDQSVCRIMVVKDHIQLSPHNVEAVVDGVARIDSARFKGNPVMFPVDESSLRRFKEWASERDEWFSSVGVSPLEIKGVEDLRILTAEVERMEAKFPELARRNETAVEEVSQAHPAKGRIGGVIELGDYPLRGQKAAADHLGVSSDKTISNYINKHQMPCLHPCKETGGEYRFNGDKIKTWYDKFKENKRQKLLGNLKK